MIAERTLPLTPARPRFGVSRWPGFAAVWLASAGVAGWLVLGDRHLRGESVAAGGIAMLILLAANVALFLWLGAVPVRSLPATPSTRRSALAVAVVVGSLCFSLLA
ncbi:MAG TPA: hypothetical protein VET26_04920 [Candidatus Sulfotelmatobacter sp.]|nr:hypothetical protein [Candidatus Sulfotelmatobacter sp.]